MNYASKKLKLFAYLIDFFIIGLLVLLTIVWFCFLDMPIWFYIVGSIGLWYIYFSLFMALIYYFSGGKSIGNLIFCLKLAKLGDKELTFGTCLIKSSLQAIFVFEFFSLLYSFKHNTHLSAIDMISESAVITINR